MCGLAYLQRHNASSAAAEFQKMINHPFTVENFVTGALAHPNWPAQTQEIGKTEAARTEYQNFLAVWKGADLEGPILQQAKAEYANLK